MKKGKTANPIDDLIGEVRSLSDSDILMMRRCEVMAQLYQARALNEIAQSLYELVRDGIGVKRPDDE